jgi:hypothetical protein
MVKSLATAVMLVTVFLTPADAACKQGEVLRTNTRGQPQCVDGIPTFAHCVHGGMQLGYSREGAERYCRPRFPQ